MKTLTILLILLLMATNMPTLSAKITGCNKQVPHTVRHLSGRYIMKGAGCAGFNFISAKTVLWYNEVGCLYPDTLKLKWIDNDSFLTISTTRFDKACPPKVDCYKIITNTSKQLVLKSIWTGWKDFKDETLVFNKQ